MLGKIPGSAQADHITSNFLKAVLHEFYLANIEYFAPYKHHKNRSTEDWDNHKRQRNFCVKLLCNTKRNYFANLNLENISDNRKFWKTIKPYFSKKGIDLNEYLLLERCFHNKRRGDSEKVQRTLYQCRIKS